MPIASIGEITAPIVEKVAPLTISRMISIITRRPFGIRDEDITCGVCMCVYLLHHMLINKLPLNVDDSCTDPALLQQIKASPNELRITTVSYLAVVQNTLSNRIRCLPQCISYRSIVSDQQ